VQTVAEVQVRQVIGHVVHGWVPSMMYSLKAQEEVQVPAALAYPVEQVPQVVLELQVLQLLPQGLHGVDPAE